MQSDLTDNWKPGGYYKTGWFSDSTLDERDQCYWHDAKCPELANFPEIQISPDASHEYANHNWPGKGDSVLLVTTLCCQKQISISTYWLLKELDSHSIIHKLSTAEENDGKRR